MIQTEKSGTLGTGNDQTIFAATPINLMVATRCKALGRGTGFGVGEPGDPANTISAAHSHGVFATAIPINDKATRWQGGGESRNHDGSGNGLGIGKDGDPSPTLTAGDRHGVMCEDVSHTLRAKANCAYREDTETYPVQNMMVRRLTPLECERLQGYPDGWTDIGEWIDSSGKKHQSSDSGRYKALGNSIALPFWFWLLRRISAQYERPATLGSLFDGISGFCLSWARCNGAKNCRWSSEIEEFPMAVTRKHFGDEKTGEVGDIEKYL